jgi:hypothetical protein
MERTVTFLAGVGVGAGLMYVLDPQMGRRRRAHARDKIVHAAHEAQDAAGAVARDVRNRAQGLASGDLSVLAGGKRALRNPLRGSWSPSARALMVLLGGGVFLYALSRSAPSACVLGSAGLALTAEGVTNAGLDDLGRLPQTVAGLASQVPEKLGLGGAREGAAQTAASGA